MNIQRIDAHKKRFLPLLLLADEQEDMIDRYLDRGVLYVLETEAGVIAECVVTDEGGGILELKSLAVDPAFQGRGFGRRMIGFVRETYRGRYRLLRVGTGDSPATVPFYERCGFTRSFRVPGFFTEHYDHPIYDGGVLLTDMIYLEQAL